MRVEKLLIAGALCIVTPYTGFAATANHEGHAGHASQKPDAALDAALTARTRTPGNIERDKYRHPRSEEHTSELQSLMRTSYAVFCLKKKKNNKKQNKPKHH